MKPEALFDFDRDTNSIEQAKANRAEYLRQLFSSYSSQRVARMGGLIGLTALVAIGLAAWSGHY